MVLANDELFNVNIEKYSNCDLEFLNESSSVGIMSEYKDNKRVYYVYRTEDMSEVHYTCDEVAIVVKQECKDFCDALEVARRKYLGLIEYNNTVRLSLKN